MHRSGAGPGLWVPLCAASRLSRFAGWHWSRQCGFQAHTLTLFHLVRPSREPRRLRELCPWSGKTPPWAVWVQPSALGPLLLRGLTPLPNAISPKVPRPLGAGPGAISQVSEPGVISWEDTPADPAGTHPESWRDYCWIYDRQLPPTNLVCSERRYPDCNDVRWGASLQQMLDGSWEQTSQLFPWRGVV